MTADKSDITKRLRQTRADMLGTDDEPHYWDCHEAAGEIERLRRWGRLTADERAAVALAADAYGDNNDDPDCERIERVLRGLLDRLSPIAKRDNDRPEAIGNCDCPGADNAPKRDTAPARGSVRPEWMNRAFWVDPPSGWAYGFPRLYDPAKDGDMTAWMVRNGYPQHLADKGLACTFTATT